MSGGRRGGENGGREDEGKEEERSNKRETNILCKKHEQKVGMLQKRADTRGVGICNMRKSIYLLTTTPTSC